MSIFQSKIDGNLKSIWRYAKFYPAIKKVNQMSLGEGNTPEVFVQNESEDSLASFLGVKELIFKREDLNPNGSHKDRLLAYQVSQAKESGQKTLIISSSGNAGISASAYCRLAGIKLFIFVSPKTDKEKIAKMAGFGASVIISHYAMTLADLAAKKFKIKNLRPGADENSYYGLKSIAFEIFENHGAIDAVFIPTSSASTVIATAEAFDDLMRFGVIDKLPAIYAVQTAKVHPIAEQFDKNFSEEKESLARGIVSRKIPKEKLIKILSLIEKSCGGGAVVSDSHILDAQKNLEKNNILTGYESAASFAGAIKARNKIKDKKIVVVLTGKKGNAKAENSASENVYIADNMDEAEKIFKTIKL